MPEVNGTAPTHKFNLGTNARLFQRQVPPPEVADIEEEPNSYVVAGIMALAKEMGKLARLIDDRSRPVDEYQVQTLVNTFNQSVVVQPQYDQISERIENIMVIGPAGNVVLQVGDRIWPLQIPAQGYLHLGPLSLLLGRNDPRILTATTPGDYGLELMGWADERY